RTARSPRAMSSRKGVQTGMVFRWGGESRAAHPRASSAVTLAIWVVAYRSCRLRVLDPSLRRTNRAPPTRSVRDESRRHAPRAPGRGALFRAQEGVAAHRRVREWPRGMRGASDEVSLPARDWLLTSVHTGGLAE